MVIFSKSRLQTLVGIINEQTSEEARVIVNNPDIERIVYEWEDTLRVNPDNPQVIESLEDDIELLKTAIFHLQNLKNRYTLPIP